jgi:hypothetical protein
MRVQPNYDNGDVDRAIRAAVEAMPAARRGWLDTG